MKNYICHSGGCPGADMTWETEGNYYGVKTIAYSFGGHKQEGKNRVILSTEELNEGFKNVLIANKTMKRYPQGQARYIQNLLARNWFQVKNAEAVFAIGMFSKLRPEESVVTRVDGGTGWAVQMAIDNKKPVYVFDQTPPKCSFDSPMPWAYFDYKVNHFVPMDTIPKLTENFAGVGTREINENGITAIQTILKENLSGVEEEQQTHFPVTEEIAGAAPVNPATLSK
jgi:hypothetical protein